MDEKRVLEVSKKAIKTWGYDAQSDMLIEEMSELTQALCKYRRHGYDKAESKYLDNVIEEMADVHNVLIQLEDYFGVEKVNKIREYKIERTAKFLQS